MPHVSICIPTRNRAKLLEVTLQSIRAQGYADTEVLVLDDASTDETPSMVERYPWVTWARYERAGGYLNDPAPIYNHLLGLAAGEILIQQSAEVVHLTPVARQLFEAVEPGAAAFATVLSGRQDQLAHISRTVRRDGWQTDGFEWYGYERRWINPDGRRPDGGEGTAVPPVSIMLGGLIVETYTSHHRPVPFFFCGAITREDWLKTGGYPEGIPHGASDLHLAIRMMELGMRFKFLGGAVAYHIAHDKS